MASVDPLLKGEVKEFAETITANLFDAIPLALSLVGAAVEFAVG